MIPIIISDDDDNDNDTENDESPASPDSLPLLFKSIRSKRRLSNNTTEDELNHTETETELTQNFPNSIMATKKHKRYLKPIEAVPGLFIINNFISKAQHTQFLSFINSQPWDTTLSRRTQHYGYRYNYRTSSVNLLDEDPVLPIPPIFSELITDLMSFNLFPKIPDQLIINEYSPGQGIAAHIDHVKFFGPVIASVSLSSDSVWVFSTHKSPNPSTVRILIPKRSCFFMTQDARYKWKHCLPKKLVDDIPNSPNKLKRKTRISLTFRTMISSES